MLVPPGAAPASTAGRFAWCLRGAEAGVDRAELAGNAAAEGPQGDDGDDGDEGQEQAVFHHAGTTLVGDVELGLDPGLQNEKVHLCPPTVLAPRERFSHVGATAPGSLLGIDRGRGRLNRPISPSWEL